MATEYQPPVKKPRTVKARPRVDVDRDQLRADINTRYENTLRYLGQ